MAIESVEATPLDYRSPGTRRPIARWMIVTSVGAAIALLGVIVFLCAHAISTPEGPYDQAEWLLHEVLWSAFGIALLLVGGLMATIGLMAWCRNDAG